MLLLAIARRLIPSHNGIATGAWDHSSVFGAPRLRGKTLGLIGCGRIGSAVALRARALGLRVVFHDPYQRYGHEKALGVERCDRLEELLSQSQFLSLHCPLTRETRHIVNAETLALLPRGAYLVNTARGPCVDLPALATALDAGQVAAAGIDVFEREPLDNERIRNHPRMVLTPHAAYYSVEGYIEMRTKGAREILRALTGEAVHNPVNLYCLTNPRCRVPTPLAAEAR
jgi:phosphoglycerate dehydrogenase-like enzyme